MKKSEPIRPGAAEALAQFLREAPERADASAEDLARELGLPESLVQQVQSYLQEPIPTDEDGDRWRDVLAALQAHATGAWNHFVDLFCEVTNRPIAFLGVTSAVGVLVASGLALVQPILQSKVQENRITLDLQAPLLAVILITLALQWGCYYRHGMVRYAVWGGAIVLGTTLPGVLLVLSLNPATTNLAGPVPLVMVTVLIVVVLGLFYTLLGAGTAVLGAVVRMRREEAVVDRMSRQDLLDRLLRVRERLSRIEAGLSDEPSHGFHVWVQRYARSPWAPAFLLGLTTGGIVVLLDAVVSTIDSPENVTLSSILALLRVIAFSVYGALMIGAAFYTGNLRRAVLAALLFAAGGVAADLLPVQGHGYARFTAGFSNGEVAVQLGMALVFGLIAGMGARVEERAERLRKLRADDPAALIAEAVRIQWRLAPRTHHVCVMAVDAVRSSLMKADADPFVAEWSFRAYHAFLEAIARRYDGNVHSTAGDGSVIAFASVKSAFAAARVIQTEIGPFNQRVNRLRSPFRLRIGLHMGELQGDLDEVEFTDVIDIAAHVQEVAPMGGIAVTERVAEALAHESLVPLRDDVDGWTVFVALNPTGD